MNPPDFFRRLQYTIDLLLDRDYSGQIIINVAPGRKIANVEIRKVVKNPE